MLYQCGINGIGMVAICAKFEPATDEKEAKPTGVLEQFPCKTDSGDVVEIPIIGFLAQLNLGEEENVTTKANLKAACVDLKGNVVLAETIPGFTQIFYREESGIIDDDDWGDGEEEDDE